MSRKTLDDISLYCCPHHLSGLSSLRLVPLLLSVLLSFPPLPWPPSWSWCQESVHGSLTPLWSLTWTGQPSWCCASVWNLRGRMYCGNALRSTICVYWGQTVQTGFYHMWGVKCSTGHSSAVSLLPQGVLDLVLDILGYGSLVDGVVRVDGCGENTFAVPVGHLGSTKSVMEDSKLRITVEWYSYLSPFMSVNLPPWDETILKTQEIIVIKLYVDLLFSDEIYLFVYWVFILFVGLFYDFGSSCFLL